MAFTLKEKPTPTPGGKSAAYGENLPLLFFGVIADFRFVKALQLQVRSVLVTLSAMELVL